MLLQGTPVNPVEWWDQHWLQDRVSKISEAGGTHDHGPQARCAADPPRCADRVDVYVPVHGRSSANMLGGRRNPTDQHAGIDVIEPPSLTVRER